jgi:hypothetical protein
MMPRGSRTCPYCGHKRTDHKKENGCNEIVQRQDNRSYWDQCHCIRFPDKLGRWRR